LVLLTTHQASSLQLCYHLIDIFPHSFFLIDPYHIHTGADLQSYH
jgi:hypothetical protein